MDKLYARIHRWMASPFVWGEDDCMIAIADYLMDLGYPDCAAMWRGTYDSALTCQKVSGYLTDPVKPMKISADFLGLEQTDEPRRGDVGVISVRHKDGKFRAVGAIYLGQNWAIRSEGSVLVDRPSHVLAAWRVDRA